MMEAIGHKTKRLTRIRFGCITIEDLKEGDIRELAIHEVKTLLVDANTEKSYAFVKARKASCPRPFFCSSTEIPVTFSMSLE